MIRRALSESEIFKGRVAAQQALNALSTSGKIIESVEDSGRHIVLIKHASGIGVGESRIVLPVGAIRVNSRQVDLALKLPRYYREVKPGTIDFQNTGLEPLPEEILTDFLRREGFPVPFHHAIGRLYVPSVPSHFYGLLTENLARPNEHLVDANGFDFKTLRNGANLSLRYDSFISKLNSFCTRGLLRLNRHISKVDPLLALKTMFAVSVNPRTSRGVLLTHDLNNVSIKNYDAIGRDLHDKHLELTLSDLSMQFGGVNPAQRPLRYNRFTP